MTSAKADAYETTTDWPAITERLRRLAQALTRSRDDADDLTQQTLVTLLVRQPERADHAGYTRRTMASVVAPAATRAMHVR